MTISVIMPSAAAWDAFVRAHRRGHLLQQSAWGTLKSAYGWSADRVALMSDDQIVGGAQLLFQRLPFRLGTMAYLPFGFYLANGQDTLAPLLWQHIDTLAKRHRAIFLKHEPGFFIDEPQPDFTQWGFQPSAQTIQPPRTVVIDLSAAEDAILARMNQGTRRKVRQSQKNDLLYTENDLSSVQKFTAMMQTTGARNEFGVHEPGYYQRAYDLFVPDDAALILAEHEGDPLAGVMVFNQGKWAWYLYGASSSEKRNLMGAYGVQWAAIQWAKRRGCLYYDMWGIPDKEESVLEAQFETRNDGLWGVYGFKRGWGGRVIRSAGAWDKVYQPLLYAAYNLAVKIRKRQSRD